MTSVESKSPKVDLANSSNFSLDSSSISQLDPNDLAAKGATLLHHLAVWMIEENKNKEASSVNNSMSDPNTESLPSTSAYNTSQGPLYENLAKPSGPVYQNLEED